MGAEHSAPGKALHNMADSENISYGHLPGNISLAETRNSTFLAFYSVSGVVSGSVSSGSRL